MTCTERVMSIPDHLIVRYGMLATHLSEKEIAEMRNGLESNTLHPKEAKMKIARAIVAMYHDETILRRVQKMHLRIRLQKAVFLKILKRIHTVLIRNSLMHSLFLE
jgi:tyrosyl-tRNA synthetase